MEKIIQLAHETAKFDAQFIENLEQQLKKEVDALTAAANGVAEGEIGMAIVAAKAAVNIMAIEGNIKKYRGSAATAENLASHMEKSI